MGYVVLRPGEIMGVSSAPLIRVSLNVVDWQQPELDPGGEDKRPLPQGKPPGPLVWSVKVASSPDPELPPSTRLSRLSASLREAFIEV